ncbi:DnaJ family domain-containing protein [Fictibacillus iocasae]|uniref:DnaJ family domain-containing protein n=1 Tax=Fictibacillus iocasae TaxID=2715437 RepID=A0ABW2NY59_9BACL
MDLFFHMAEQKIKEAERKGVFDDLPGKGKPLKLEDDSSVPAELRASYKVLKNAGMVPAEVQLKKEVLKIEDLLQCCTAMDEQERLKKQLNEKTLRFQELMERRKISQSLWSRYGTQINRKF